MLLSLVLPAACGESGDDPAPSGGHPGQPETPGGNEGGDPGETSLKIGITVGSRTITATMEDNAAARDFLSRLPLEVTLSDYSNAEKIFYPSPALTTSKVARGCTPAPGDITIYVPWGNVAIFYKNGSRSNDLIRIGRIDGNGIEALSIPGSLSVRIERQRRETPENNSEQNPSGRSGRSSRRMALQPRSERHYGTGNSRRRRIYGHVNSN